MTRRRWWLAGLGLLILLLRAALPEVARRVAESQASEALRARVHIGDVDLGLLRGVVALEDVAVRPAVPPEGAAAAVADDGTIDLVADPPVVSWQRFAVNLRWFALPWKAIQFSSVELRDPRVAVDRLADGALNLMAFLPVAAGAEAGATPDAAAVPADEQNKAKPWGVAVDRLALVGGHLRFRDFAVRDAEPVDIGLPTIVVRDVALQPGHYGGPARTSVDVRVDDGRLRVNTRFSLREGGAALETTLRARRMPLRRVRFYVPDVGWNEVRGELGASLVHRLSTGERNEVRGGVTLDDVTVRVPDVEEPALTWKHLAVALDRIDLQGHRADVADVELTGMTLALVRRGAILLALLSGREAPEPAAADVPAPPPPPATDAPAATAAAAPEPAASEPWRWSLARLRIGDSRIRMITDEGMQDVGMELEAGKLAGDGDQVAPVKLGLTMDAARIALDGGARIAQPGFDGTLTVSDLPVPDVERLAAVLLPGLLQQGVLDADLKLAVGSAASPAGDVTVSGTLALRDFAMQGKDPKEFSVAVAATEVEIGELRVPRVLAPEAEAGAATPVTVRLTSLTVSEPHLQLTREKNGLVLPPFTPAAADAKAPAAATPPPAAPAATKPAPGTKAQDPVDLTVDSMKVVKGQIRVTDRTVKPFFAGGFSPLDIDVRTLRWPATTMDRMRLEATSLTRGKLTVTGRMTASGGNVEVNGKDIALQPFNPYATHYSAYSITGGALSVDTKATFGKGKYDSKTELALDGFDLGGKEGDSLFREQFGVPLEVALALLRDIAGRIAFDIPVTGDEKGAKVAIGTLIGQALRKALVGALASPLKLVGAAFGGKGGQTAPTPIAFRAGAAEPTDQGEKHLEALAGLLASRPGIGITLKGAPTKSDARRLHEQGLYEELARPQGVFGAIGNLAQRGARERIRLALEARGKGEKGDLAPEDERKLDEWLADRREPTKKKLAALVKARLDAVSTKLREGRGIGPERVRASDPVGEVRDGDPTVEFDLGAAAPAG